MDAPDRPGLFATTAVFLSDRHIGIDAVHAATVDARACDVFLTDGPIDGVALEARLRGDAD